MNARRRVVTLSRQGGQGMLEFQIIAVLVLIPLLLGVIQMGLLVMAKNTVNVAALATARAGAASGGSMDEMRNALAIALAPLHANEAKSDTGVGMNDISAGNYTLVMGAALVRSRAENVLWSRITVLNPTRDSFTDFGVTRSGNTIIPVTNVYNNMQVGARSRQTRGDALLLKIEVRYCHYMVIPIIRDVMTGVLNGVLSGASAADRACYLADRMPIVSQAVVRMTTPPVRRTLLGS